jgi:hypothetical protein
MLCYFITIWILIGVYVVICKNNEYKRVKKENSEDNNT